MTTGEGHLQEVELARLSEKDLANEMVEHLRWCDRCREAAADHRWLQGEIAAALTVVAETLPVPPSAWWRVQERLFVSRRRQVARARASVLAGVVLAVCLLLGAPSLSGLTVTAQPPRPDVVIAPTPVPVRVRASSVGAAPGEVAVTAVSVNEAASLPSPAFEPPPTPPRTEARNRDLETGFRNESAGENALNGPQRP